MIWTFGNSHVSIFSGTDTMVPIWPLRSVDKLPWFRTFRLGPITAWASAKYIPTILGICQQMQVNKQTDIVLMVLGEVDMRAHVVKQSIEQERPVEEIVADVVERYVVALKKIQSEGYKLAVFGCIAGFVLKPGAKPPAWPHVGTVYQRNAATRQFNNLVRDECRTMGATFVSVFEDMLEPVLMTKIKYLDEDKGGCHLTTRILPLLLWKFRDVGLISWDEKFVQWEG